MATPPAVSRPPPCPRVFLRSLGCEAAGCAALRARARRAAGCDRCACACLDRCACACVSLARGALSARWCVRGVHVRV